MDGNQSCNYVPMGNCAGMHGLMKVEYEVEEGRRLAIIFARVP